MCSDSQADFTCPGMSQAGAEGSYHGHGLGRQHLLGAQRGEVSQVGQHIHQCDHRQGDDDSQGQVPRKKPSIVLEQL